MMLGILDKESKNTKVLSYSLFTGFFIGMYSLTDGYGARISNSAVSYISWSFLINALIFPIVLRFKNQKNIFLKVESTQLTLCHIWEVFRRGRFKHQNNQTTSSRFASRLPLRECKLTPTTWHPLRASWTLRQPRKQPNVRFARFGKMWLIQKKTANS